MSKYQHTKRSGMKEDPTIRNLPDSCDAAASIQPFHMEQLGDENIMGASSLAQVDTEKFVPESASAMKKQGLVIDSVIKYAEKFRGLRHATSENIIEMGRLVCDAKAKLDDFQFQEFCVAIGLESESSTIRKYEHIGERADVLSSHSADLPSAWTSIYQLAQLAPVTLKKVLDDGVITPEITGNRIKEIVAKNTPRKSSVMSAGKNCKKYHYQYGKAFEAPLGEALERDLDMLIADFIAKRDNETSSFPQLNGGK